MMQSNSQLKKIIYIGVGVIVLALLAYIFILGLKSSSSSGTLNIQSIVPTDASVTVDNHQVNSNGNVSVTPGQHTVVAKRNGFADKTLNTTVKAGETQNVNIIMTPNSNVGYQWLTDHPDAAVQFEGQQGAQYTQNSQTTTDKNPLIAYLPEIRPTWRIDYGKSKAHPNDPTAVAIIITYGGADIDKQNALQWIKDQGFNPDDYEIIFQLPPQPGN